MNTEKLKLFFQGRKGLLPRIEAACSGQRDILWFHVASYGEFEEARPVIEATRARFPERKILLTVFSPTVFVPMQHYRQVDWVFYLPLDTPRQVRRFLDAVRPAKAIFTITDFWPVLLNALRRRKVDTYIMSVRIEPDSHHLKWHSFLFRQIIRNCYKCVMVQNEESRRLLEGIGVPSVKLTGDPRIDRVLAISGEAWSDPVADAWGAGQKVFVAGSTYGVEDRMVLAVAAAHPEGKFLLIPHEPEDAAVEAILAQAPHGAVRYTDYEGKEADDALRDAQILVVDTVGLLSRLYRYGFAAYVGGSFTEGSPHSVVEPASYGMPVSFGPNYRREAHCRDLVALGAGVSISDREGLEAFYAKAAGDAAFLETSSRVARAYCLRNAGATEAILDILFD